MDALVAQGIELTRNYVHKYCSPTRSAIQSGRHPMHVNVMNLNPNYHNPQDPVSGFSGIPRNMTGLGELMKRGNYRTAFAGKWDAGMATFDHTPRGRGYDQALHYFHHMNDYWRQFYVGNSGISGGDNSRAVRCAPNVSSYPVGAAPPVDLWLSPGGGKPEGPATLLNGSQECSAETADPTYPGAPEVNTCKENDADGSGCPPYPGWPNDQVSGCKYEDALFTDFVLSSIEKHPLTRKERGRDVPQDLFLFWSPHIAHTPLQVPKKYLDRFLQVDDWRRRRYLAMVNYLDDAVGKVVDLLDKRGMLNDTLIVFSSDNGGPVYGNGTSGGNNWPLRGGKASNWEGGIRVNGWVSGGAVPHAMRGRKIGALTTPWDWWKTFAEIAAIHDVMDHKAAAAQLPPVGGVSQWPLWSGKTQTPARKTLAIATCTSAEQGFDMWCSSPDDVTIVSGLIVDEGKDGLWKVLQESIVPMSGWQGPVWPNATTTEFQKQIDRSCGGANGCLYRIDVDPTEHKNVAQEPANAGRLKNMKQLLQRMNATTFSPDRGQVDFEASCGAAYHKWQGFWGPFLE
jgi:arylsulfatase I/J